MLDPKCIYRKSIFPKCIFPKRIYPKCISAKCTRLAYLLSFASLFILVSFKSHSKYILIKDVKAVGFILTSGKMIAWKLSVCQCQQILCKNLICLMHLSLELQTGFCHSKQDKLAGLVATLGWLKKLPTDLQGYCGGRCSQNNLCRGLSRPVINT